MRAEPVPEPWQSRSDRMARLLLLPILAVATMLTVITRSGSG
jgi:hypothetical protein